MAEGDDIQPRETRRARTLDALEATIDDAEAITIGEAEPKPRERQGDKPEDASAKLAAQLKERDAELAAARASEADANRRAAEAGATVISAAARTLNEREASIGSAITARNTVIANAEAALKAATEASDYAAMSKATREISRAEAELVNLEREKSAVEADKQRLKDAPVPRQEAGGPTAESRAWIDAHPRFNIDPEYQQRVMAADNAWRARTGGRDVGTKAYVDFIESNVRAYYGRDDHGSLDAMKDRAQPRDSAPGKRPASSTAARADAGTDGGSSGAGGSLTYQHAQGSISLRTGSDGKESVVGKIPAAWVAAASWSGFGEGDRKPGGGTYKTKQEGAEAYAIEQMHILQEQRQGGTAGLLMGDGTTLQ